MPDDLRSLPDVCEVERFVPAGRDSARAPDLLIEVPHGATRTAHYEAVRRRLCGDLPDDLRDFFYVNTDVGAPECARAIAAALAAAPRAPLAVLVLRCLVPRTFIDCNRVIERGGTDYGRTGVTKGLPDYVTDRRDIAALTALYRAYREMAGRAYDRVCGGGGRALTLHTYAPRAVSLERFDRDIAAALRAAYEPRTWATWPLRPEVDLISRDDEGTLLASAPLLEAVTAGYARLGVEVAENASYRLHPVTMGHRFSSRFPGRVLCLEIRRDLLAEPFAPFSEMTIGVAKVVRMTSPIVAAYLAVEGADERPTPRRRHDPAGRGG